MIAPPTSRVARGGQSRQRKYKYPTICPKLLISRSLTIPTAQIPNVELMVVPIHIVAQVLR